MPPVRVWEAHDTESREAQEPGAESWEREGRRPSPEFVAQEPGEEERPLTSLVRSGCGLIQKPFLS